MNGDYVNVTVRVKPFEPVRDSVNIINYDGTRQAIYAADKIFIYDNVFSGSASQADLYESVAKPYLDKIKAGYNCSILAYGQTGTGKTYTMGSQSCIEACGENPGLIPRILEQIFETFDKDQYRIAISFYEIYNEKVYDLLGCQTTNLPVKGFVVPDLVLADADNARQALTLLLTGCTNRHTGRTNVNAISSRSHAVFTIHFHSRAEEGTRKLKFNLVDLAGSESVRKTGNQGTAFQEGIFINKGLLAIGRVINALAKKAKAVPYRESTLTSILQDSFNGKSYVSLIACVSPSSEDMKETYATLRFAEETKSVANQPKKLEYLKEFKKNNPEAYEQMNSFEIKTPFKTPTINRLIRGKHVLKPNKILHDITENDTINFSSVSTSTVIQETPTISFSPIMRRCDQLEEQLRTIMREKNDSYKENMSPGTIIRHVTKTIKREIHDIFDEAKPGSERKHSSPLVSHEENAPPSKKLNFSGCSPVQDEGMSFKIPVGLPKRVVRRSTRLSRKISLQNLSLEDVAFSASEKIPVRRSERFKKPPTIYQRVSPIQKRASKRLSMTTINKPLLSSHRSKILNILNTGNQKKLETLSTIGQKAAQKIFMYRSLHGSFKNYADLKKLPGWGQATYEKFLKDNFLE